MKINQHLCIVNKCDPLMTIYPLIHYAVPSPDINDRMVYLLHRCQEHMASLRYYEALSHCIGFLLYFCKEVDQPKLLEEEEVLIS